MKDFFRFNDASLVRWQPRGIERLRRAWRRLQRLLLIGRQPEALVLIPLRAVQPHVTRQRRRRAWRD